MPILKFKKGDNVKIITGKDKGKTAKIVAVDRKSLMITVEGINLLTRFQRPKKSGQKGQKVRLPAPLKPNKVMAVCPSCGKATRIGYKTNEEGKKLRYCKKCQANF